MIDCFGVVVIVYVGCFVASVRSCFANGNLRRVVLLCECKIVFREWEFEEGCFVVRV